MVARKKVLRATLPKTVSLDLASYSDRPRATIEKDRCLLEAALSADRIIVTRDESLPQALAERPDGVALLKSLRWINPQMDGAAALRDL
ncbi:MAG: hypothetical protein AB1486_08040 [Planctomycetota bacterium]